MEKMIEDLWNEHYQRVFPKGCGGKEIQGIDLALLDTFTAGCIQTFIYHGQKYKYRLDEPRIAILGKCYRQLAIIQPFLTTDESKDYFSRLDKMAGLVLDWISAHRRSNP
jgi:hypothetical protein